MEPDTYCVPKDLKRQLGFANGCLLFVRLHPILLLQCVGKTAVFYVIWAHCQPLAFKWEL